MSPTNDTHTPDKRTTTTAGFTAEEKAAMRARTRELKAPRRGRAPCSPRLQRWSHMIGPSGSGFTH